MTEVQTALVVGFALGAICGAGVVWIFEAWLRSK